MPEGDTIHRAAAMLREAVQRETIVDIRGSHRAIAPHRSRLIGRRIETVDAHGKHLLIHVERGWTVRTHLAMTGHWHVYGLDEPWRTTPGKARIVIQTHHAIAVCFAAPYIEIGPTEHVMERLGRIGPDLTAADAPFAAIAENACKHEGPTMADLLVDQSVASGIGNVFKSEVLYLEGTAPHDPPSAIEAPKMERLYRRASRLLAANVASSRRSTTGSRRRGHETWVYGRAGQPCRRCGATIETDHHGDLDRSTYWCPRCQPPVASATPRRRSASKG